MPIATEQFVAAQRALLDTAQNVSLKALEGATRLFELNAQAVRATVSEATEQAKSLLGSEPTKVVSQGFALVQPNAEKLVSYSKQAYEIVSATNSEIAELLQKHVDDAQELAVVAIDNAAKTAPAGSEIVFNAARNTFGAARNAYEQAVNASRRFSEQIEQNVVATAKVNGRATKKAAGAAAV